MIKCLFIALHMSWFVLSQLVRTFNDLSTNLWSEIIIELSFQLLIYNVSTKATVDGATFIHSINKKNLVK